MSDPYERMLGDALESVTRAHDAIHGLALEINTAKSERITVFRHIDSLRAEIKTLDKLIRGNGDSSKGLRSRVDHLESTAAGAFEGAKMRWWAIGTTIAALGSVAAHFLE